MYGQSVQLKKLYHKNNDHELTRLAGGVYTNIASTLRVVTCEQRELARPIGTAFIIVSYKQRSRID